MKFTKLVLVGAVVLLCFGVISPTFAQNPAPDRTFWFCYGNVGVSPAADGSIDPWSIMVVTKVFSMAGNDKHQLVYMDAFRTWIKSTYADRFPHEPMIDSVSCDHYYNNEAYAQMFHDRKLNESHPKGTTTEDVKWIPDQTAK
jgi:hypothetical protein